MKSNEFTTEGDVIQHKFATKQAQKGKDQYKHNADLEADIPMFDRAGMRNVAQSGVEYPDHVTAKMKLEPYDHFEVKPTGSGSSAHIMGVTTDGMKVQTSTTVMHLAKALVDAYNRGGFTDKDIRKVPLGDVFK